MQIHLGSQHVHVAHVGGEPRQTRVDIHLFLVPVSESMRGEGMTPVIGTRAERPRAGFSPSLRTSRVIASQNAWHACARTKSIVEIRRVELHRGPSFFRELCLMVGAARLILHFIVAKEQMSIPRHRYDEQRPLSRI
jgi:hypothetical protein